VGINTNALTLGSSMPAKTTVQARSGSGPGQIADNSDASDAPAPGSTAAAGGSGQPATAEGATNTGQKTAGPALQARGAQSSPTRATARTTRATNSTGPATSAASTETQDTADDPTGDFGSVMAEALVRGATSTTHQSASPKTAADATDSTTSKTPGQQAPAVSADPVPLFIPVLAPSTPATQPTAPATGDTATGRPVLAAVNALQARINVTPLSQVEAAPMSAGQPAIANPASEPAAAVTGSLSALTDSQKLISRLSVPSPGSAGDDVSTVTTAHAATANGVTDTAQAAAALQSSLDRTGASVGGATLIIQAPVSSAAFADEVSARVTALAQSAITQAQLQLNPADMGPVHVQITVQSGQASVWFGATHSDTRAALEASLPRLRELFANAGMPLSDSGVFREPPQQQAQPLPQSSSSQAAAIEPAPAAQITNVRLGLLDTYA
jgi:flagellar hook-length control protein FliK